MQRKARNFQIENKENNDVNDDGYDERVEYGPSGGGEMQISDKYGENEMLVRHIRQTSSITSSVGMNDVIRVQKLAKIVNTAPEVHLKVLSSGKLRGQILRINAQGLIGALRQRNDGFAFFGCKKYDIKKSAT
jgi:uncharacterized protein